VILRGKVSLCRACGKVFTTTSTFDKHRVGKYSLTAPAYGRRCLTGAELKAAGWQINARGRWSRRRMPLEWVAVIQDSTITTDPLVG
jgi:hypothetical protein